MAEEQPKKKRFFGGLSAVFNKESLGNMALGAGVMASAKALTGAALTLTAAPALPALAATVATGAIVSLGLEHIKMVREDRKHRSEQGEVLNTTLKGRFSEYLSLRKFGENFLQDKSRFLKKAGFNMAAGLTGGLAVIAADNIGGIIETFDDWKDKFLGGTTHEVVVTEPITTEIVKPDSEDIITDIVAEPIFDPEQPFTDDSVLALTGYKSLNDMPYIERMGYILDAIQPKTEAVERLYTLLDNVKPDADGIYSSYDYARMKELAYTAYNGLDGFEQIPENIREQVAVELYQAAAEGGNIQAQTDLAYIQYHGLAQDLVPQNQDAALETINKLDRSWVGGEKLLDSYNPETANLPEIDLSAEQRIATCNVTEHNGRTLEDTHYEIRCQNPIAVTANQGSYIEYKLQNFDIMGEDTVRITDDTLKEPIESVSFIARASEKLQAFGVLGRSISFGSLAMK